MFNKVIEMGKRNIELTGRFVILKEIQPEFFKYIIEWRNNPELNKFLNQPFKLTMELEKQWYEEKYLNDMTQGLFVLIDKKNNVPFGTLGYTDYNSKEKICVGGRALIGNSNYIGGKEFNEAVILLNDFLYNDLNVEVIYGHIAINNKKIISWNKKMGFIKNLNNIRFENELNVNGIKQEEWYRTKSGYEKARMKIVNLLNYFKEE